MLYEYNHFQASPTWLIVNQIGCYFAKSFLDCQSPFLFDMPIKILNMFGLLPRATELPISRDFILRSAIKDSFNSSKYRNSR